MGLADDFLQWVWGAPKGSGDYLSGPAGRFFTSNPLPMAICNKAGKIVAANTAFGRLFRIGKVPSNGMTLSPILGEKASRLPTLAGKENPTVLAGEFPKVGEKILNVYSREIRNQFLLVFQDVTKEGELASKIVRSRQELLAVFDGIDDPMVMIDKNFRIRRINEAMLKALGAASYKGFIGKACWFKMHGRSERCEECTADRTFATGTKTSRLGLIERRPRADEFSYQITCYPLKDSSGSVTGIAELYRDVTEVQRTEEELYESERSRVMEPLTAGIAHEVRNPLAIIQSTAQYCLGELGPNHKDLRESLQAIVRNTQQANRVIGNLLDFAKPSPADFRRQPIGPLLQKALGLIKARAGTQRVRIVRRISGGLPPLLLDGNRFVQAMMNFLVNSLDAMPEGGRLEIEAHRQGKNGSVAILIRDSGKGIPAEMLPKILQPFYSTKTNGVGLGLPIAEGIVRSHEERVRFRSWPGKGTEVRIELPTRQKLLRGN